MFGNILFVKMEFQNEIMKRKKKQNQADCHILALLLYGKFKHPKFKMPACVGYLFPLIPSGYPRNTHKVSQEFL
jgi:hypothetical protein